ncbi:hypothetical protein CALVIDRAFT_250885 [Calocera viscosa TUFC12733]|uniref:Uncharacterized protein n=1 Tax=Calocera viscosa (strain TUFC12733) TaxID=1330018 RepID=A0A167JEV3_CALVF|nr:hypothetical protein CALVIDRAFT_250885 [Calocera viscosa TUFC12733]
MLRQPVARNLHSEVPLPRQFCVRYKENRGKLADSVHPLPSNVQPIQLRQPKWLLSRSSSTQFLRSSSAACQIPRARCSRTRATSSRWLLYVACRVSRPKFDLRNHFSSLPRASTTTSRSSHLMAPISSCPSSLLSVLARRLRLTSDALSSSPASMPVRRSSCLAIALGIPSALLSFSAPWVNLLALFD